MHLPWSVSPLLIWILALPLALVLSLFQPGGGGQIYPHPGQTRIPVKNQWVEILFLYIPKCISCTLETIFHGEKNFPFGRGIGLSWSETPYFHKGGPLLKMPKLPLSAEM